jgi:hypothetical protein
MRRPNSIPHVAQAQPSAVTNWIGVYGLAPPLSTGDRAVGPTLVTAVPVSQQKVARYGDLNSVEPVADPYAEQQPPWVIADAAAQTASSPQPMTTALEWCGHRIDITVEVWSTAVLDVPVCRSARCAWER